jgi:hypothetical protein
VKTLLNSILMILLLLMLINRTTTSNPLSLFLFSHLLSSQSLHGQSLLLFAREARRECYNPLHTFFPLVSNSLVFACLILIYSYYEYCLKLLKVGGVIAVDNTLWHGQVLNKEDQTPDNVAIRELNEKIHKDKRVDIAMLCIADGLTLCRKL